MTYVLASLAASSVALIIVCTSALGATLGA